MPTITPFLWFEDDAEEAMHFYASVFKDSSVAEVRRFDSDVVPGPQGNTYTGTFTICGQEFMVLNGGPNDDAKFTQAISLFVQVDTQEEIDYYWDALTADGGQPGPCGWLTDKYGLSWQIVPKVLGTLMGDPDRAKAESATKAMLQMSKITIADLQRAFDSGQ